MKHLKKFNENVLLSDMVDKLNNFGIKNYTINSDGTIDVDGNVELNNMNLFRIPFKFGKVSGGFTCGNNRLRSLDGSPKEVGRGFICSDNKLVNLIGGPEYVGGNYICTDNRLETLEGLAPDILGNLNCSDNDLTILDTSSVISGNIYCPDNEFKEEPEFFGVCGGKIYWK